MDGYTPRLAHLGLLRIRKSNNQRLMTDLNHKGMGEGIFGFRPEPQENGRKEIGFRLDHKYILIQGLTFVVT